MRAAPGYISGAFPEFAFSPFIVIIRRRKNKEDCRMFEKKLIAGMNGFNKLIHVLLALVLGIACAMVIWDVGAKIILAWHEGNASQGFFHALGSLFILWTLSTLISAEINYIQTGRVYARVFVVVAMISIIRELIVQPMQAITAGADKTADAFNPVQYGLLLAALLVTGIVYRLVSNSANGQDNSHISLDA
jgi:uncharacterized membrane protein (DUF373 family)